jgi:glycosyltransferase involved in cell wall biosynthesis
MDRDALLALVSPGGRPAPVSVLSNGVDLDYYRQPGQIQKEIETIVFSGKMSYHANSTMAAYLVDQIMPRVWREKPNVRAVIVGKDPSPAIRKFAENPRITVTGTVDDLRPHLWKAGVAVVPLIYGAGIQNKILEAMAAGTPVVASSRTLSAMRAKAGSDLLVADRPEEFAAQILRLMANPSLYDDVRRNGLAYVETFHDWHTIAKQLVDIFRETIARKKRRSG